MSLTNQQLARYVRQVSLAGFGGAAQEKLLRAHVLVVGAGGLGSPALLYLAGAGVGHVTVIDDDEVSLSNLHRQVLHSTAAVGTPKVDSARAALDALNPEVEVTAINGRLTRDNAQGLLADVDVVLDGSDNLATRYLTSWACARAGIPHVWASILGFDAQLSVFWAGHGPLFEDVFPTPPAPGTVPSCAAAGVLGPVVGTVGSAMAMEAIKLVTGIGTPLMGRVGYFSALDGTWEYLPVVAHAETARRVTAGVVLARAVRNAELEETTMHDDVKEVDSIPDGALIIDVRDPEEVVEAAIPGSVNFPLADIEDGGTPPGVEQALDRDQPVVLHCAGGKRSAQAVKILQERGLDGPLYSLRGGINAWLEDQL